MPSIKNTTYAPEFSEMRDEAFRLGSDKDCAVKAVALLCDQPYSKVLNDMSDMGRKINKGTSWQIIRKAFKLYGYDIVRVPTDEIIGSFPRPHCNVLKNFTTHHPRRFPGCLDQNKRYLLDCNRHVAAVLGGEVKDWSINNSLRVTVIYEVVKA